MDDNKTLIDAAYVKLRNGEPMSPDDFQRAANLFLNSPWALAPVAQEVQISLYSNLLDGLQKFQANITKAMQNAAPK